MSAWITFERPCASRDYETCLACAERRNAYPYFVVYGRVSRSEAEQAAFLDAVQWCRDNCPDQWAAGPYYYDEDDGGVIYDRDLMTVSFTTEAAAALFKLVWC